MAVARDLAVRNPGRTVIRILIQHCLSALYPDTAELPGIRQLDLPAYTRDALADMPWLMWVGVVLSAVAFVISPVLTVFWPLPSFLLPASVLDRHADRAAGSSLYVLRQAVFLLKMVAGLHWARTPQVREVFALPPYPPDPDGWRQG